MAQLHSRAGLSLPADHRGALQAPLEPFALGGGLCAVLRYRGPYASMRAAYRWFYGQWLVQSGHAAANLPVTLEGLGAALGCPAGCERCASAGSTALR